MNETDKPTPAAAPPPPSPRPWHALIPGLLVLGLGFLFLSHTMGWIASPWRYLPLWPWAFIVLIGLLKMSRGSAHDVIVGLLITLFGGALIMQTLGYWTDIWRFWPVLLIGAGVLLMLESNFPIPRSEDWREHMSPEEWRSRMTNRIVWRAQRRAWRAQRRAWRAAQWRGGWYNPGSAGFAAGVSSPPGAPASGAGPAAAGAPDAAAPETSTAAAANGANAAGAAAGAAVPGVPSGEWLNMEAYFSENKRRVVSPGFHGGHLLAVFGACKLDLRAAPLPAGARLSIDANVVFGEIQIYVPSHWKISVHGAGIFGNFQDDTLPPVTPLSENDIRLDVFGSSAFGQVSVRN